DTDSGDGHNESLWVNVYPMIARKLIRRISRGSPFHSLRLWPTIFSGKIDVFPGDRRSRLISSMTSVAPA
ncbi:hypothetical protein FOT46_25055, partial [Citrobacter freundii]|nr:hypothetical protein [Citrobacter freundii]